MIPPNPLFPSENDSLDSNETFIPYKEIFGFFLFRVEWKKREMSEREKEREEREKKGERREEGGVGGRGYIACVECDDVAAVLECVECGDVFCGLCYEWLHRRGHRAHHTHRPIHSLPPHLPSDTKHKLISLFAGDDLVKEKGIGNGSLTVATAEEEKEKEKEKEMEMEKEKEERGNGELLSHIPTLPDPLDEGEGEGEGTTKHFMKTFQQPNSSSSSSSHISHSALSDEDESDDDDDDGSHFTLSLSLFLPSSPFLSFHFSLF